MKNNMSSSMNYQYSLEDEYLRRENEIINYFKDREREYQKIILELENRTFSKILSDEEILERMPFNKIEKFLREKKLKNINEKNK